MRRKRMGRRKAHELRDWIARFLALLDEQHQANEAPSETWRAFNLSNVVRGRVEECQGGRSAGCWNAPCGRCCLESQEGT
jgi:hypothetical protein